MRITTRRTLLAAGLAMPAVTALRPASAQGTFPDHPISLVIPWPAGGSTDALGRLLAQALGNELGQPVVVDNRGGASGTLGHAYVARARPDGYTLLMATNSTYAIAPHLMRGLPYENRTSFTGISMVARSAQSLCVHPSVPVNSLQEFIAHAKAKPGEVTFSSAGIGASSHLAMELFQSMTGTRLLHVPYRGGGPSVQGLLTGEVACSFVDLVTALPFRQQRQMKLLGVSTAGRSELASDVPTIAESGVPGFDSSTDVIMLLPAGAPAPIVNRITAALLKVVKDPEMHRRIIAMGIEPIGSTAAELETYWTREFDKWGAIIRSQNITLG